MKITCAISRVAQIAYIYLQSVPNLEIDHSKNLLLNNLHGQDIEMPFLQDPSFFNYLDGLKQTSYSFFEGYHESYFETEYGFDFDQDQYVIGYEQGLPPEKFVELVINQSYKRIETVWREHEYQVVTLDFPDEVISTNNMLCRLNDNMDSFFILELVDPSKLGVFYPDDNDKKIAIIKALVTKNEQVYPRAYLSSPDFILYLDEEGPFDQL